MSTPTDLKLPSPPLALAKVIEAASDANTNVSALGRLVSNDPGFVVQLLRMVNSSLYQRGSKITSAERAVAFLGSRSLRNLALCVAVRNCVSRREIGEFDLNRFWEESLRRAVAARLLAERVAAADVDPMEAFTASLVQDIGVLGLVRTKPELGGTWMEAVGTAPDARRARERELFGASHDDIAASIAEKWGMVDELAMPLRFHHCPEQAPAEFTLRARIAQQAEVLGAVLGADDKGAALALARQGASHAFGMSEAGVDSLLEALGERVASIASELGFKVGAQPTLEEVLRGANRGLIELNLSYEELVVKLERTLDEKEQLARELARRNRDLEQLSLTDELTGLPNRRALVGRLSYEIKRAARDGRVAFAVCDLDKFKTVNDTWGHDFGDRVLKAVADAMLEAVRETDMVARLGGEEFGVVLPDADLEGARVVAERMRILVREKVLTTPDGSNRSFTISIGFAVIEGPYRNRVSADGVATSLYKAADAALYASKLGGRDRCTPATDPVTWTVDDDGRAAA